jgi:catechol 2,3-dioxygenase
MDGTERAAEAGNGSSEPHWGIPAPSYRLPAALRLGPVRLAVAELERSLDFYREILGLRVIEEADGGARLGPTREDGSEGAQPLVDLRELPGAAAVPPGGRPGLYHFALLLPDRSRLSSFAAHLAAADFRPGAADHRVSEALYLSDPDGLGIEVYADRPRERWSSRGRELLMTTDPLDVRALVREGAEHPWRGMPAGTRMGHLHLHVGDLEWADAFYHRALGLDRVVWSYPGALFLSAGGYHHHLGVNTWARNPVPAAEGDARLLEWEMILPRGEEAGQAAASLAQAGWEVRAGPGGSYRVRDPWGTVLRLRAEGEG